MTSVSRVYPIEVEPEVGKMVKLLKNGKIAPLNFANTVTIDSTQTDLLDQPITNMRFQPILLDDNRIFVLVSYFNTTVYIVYGIVYKFVNGVVSKGTKVVIQNPSTQAACAVKVSGDKLMVAFIDNTLGKSYVQMCTVADTTITLDSTKVEIAANTFLQAKGVYLKNGIVAMSTHRSNYVDGYTFDCTGNTPVIVSSFINQHYSAYFQSMNIFRLNESTVAFQAVGGESSNAQHYLKLNIANVSANGRTVANYDPITINPSLGQLGWIAAQVEGFKYITLATTDMSQSQLYARVLNLIGHTTVNSTANTTPANAPVMNVEFDGYATKIGGVDLIPLTTNTGLAFMKTMVRTPYTHLLRIAEWDLDKKVIKFGPPLWSNATSENLPAPLTDVTFSSLTGPYNNAYGAYGQGDTALVTSDGSKAYALVYDYTNKEMRFLQITDLKMGDVLGIYQGAGKVLIAGDSKVHADLVPGSSYGYKDDGSLYKVTGKESKKVGIAIASTELKFEGVF